MRIQPVVRWMALCLASAAGGETVVLDASGFWRVHITLRTPLIRDGEGLKEVGAACNTEPPASNWTAVDFDDSGWGRQAGAPFASWSHWDPGAQANVGFVYCHASSLATAQLCLRGKFHLDDPARAQGLKLAVRYRGGAAVHINGKELARGHLPREGALSPDTPAAMYPREAYYLENGGLLQGYGREGSKSERLQLRLRDLEVSIPREALRKGTNVLAVALYRAPLPSDVYDKLKGMRENLNFALWDACGLYSARLSAPSGDAVRANATRPTGVQLWNSSLLASDTDLDWGDPNEPLKPIRIVGTRNGCFSGKVLVGSHAPLTGLKASITDLAGPQGAAIPASAIALRYAAPDLPRKPANVNRFDSLLEAPPAEVPVRQKQPAPNWVRTLPGQPAPVYGAVVPVWVTVRVPAVAVPGDYAGTLRVNDAAVPVQLHVSGFRLPNPRDYRTFVELVQSPDTLAVEYGVPLWSDAHWKLIEKSLVLIAQVGAKTCYVPLICETNLGNEQTVVRWVKQGDGQYRHDFSVMDRYLDLVTKHLGPSTLVCLYVWDNFLEGGRFTGDLKYEPKDTQADRLAYQGKGPGVTVVEGGRASTLVLPQYSGPASKPLWQGLARELLERMKKRRLEKNLMLGLLTDTLPTAEAIALWSELLPGVPWASHAHPYRDKVHGVPVVYTSAVWHPRFISHDGTSRQGWRNPRLMVQFARDVSDLNPLTTFRLIGEMNIGGDQRGFTRWGADLWPVLDDQRGARTGRVYERYPKASWRNLNVKTALLGPSPDGPVATARFEALREGIQECEARIAIEQALATGELPQELAAKCREVIAERNRAIVMGLSPHKAEGFQDAAAYARIHDWHCDAGVVGYTWYLTSSWQEGSQRLYDAAAEAERLRTGGTR
ncbi:MAG: hypothetical protein FJ290_15485 [Planctomycetes bacterium]|nr:hypothetical protein [Planctomycetota bacterium]